ncbi:MAG TPA: ferredoxin--NADP(+) reductase [Idiomarina baltica]|uniref:ferredoxin--NADP(+) reductase n=1 Tax=Idiomarina baltica TaxID=190892 RepID=A0A348WNF5_9GAMM|nr:ferredoxin--NADP reductase [Idiomarina sp. T82-3]KXS34419.1 MAG: ferredoxin-NADP reductase [Idiomarina sp. T82-3]HAR56067.1 ferredoxin--NADP(+) reductase [Idiomarina baltica]|tara:strand:+ start:259 stop:999 length:741 start_codon:yes stop_codon:yes gene_type:complete
MIQWISGKVVENFQWSDSVFSLRVITESFDFKAGQFVRLGLNVGGEQVLRAYSVASAPQESILDFVIAKVEGGLLSPLLAELKPGDEVNLTQPAGGFFTLDEVPDGDDLWMLSTGTGIGPFISMLRTEQPWRRFKRIVIVQGVREAQDLTYREFINECQQRYPGQLVYQPIVSREALPEALAGRIPDLIASNELQEACGVHFNERSQVMLCGNPDMIQASREQLKALGLEKNTRRKPGQVTSENYW